MDSNTARLEDDCHLSPAMKIMLILEQFKSEPELGIRELGRRTGISKSAVHSLVTEMVSGGLLSRAPGGRKYRLGLGLLAYGALVQARSDLLAVARPVLRSLSHLSDENVNLRILHDAELISVDHILSSHDRDGQRRFGEVYPAHWSSLGKAVLAFQDPIVVDQVITRGLSAPSPFTLTEPDKLRRELKLIRTRGYATVDPRSGVNSVGAPIRWPDGSVNAALSISGPATRLTRDKLLRLVDPLVDGAKTISLGLCDGTGAVLLGRTKRLTEPNAGRSVGG